MNFRSDLNEFDMLFTLWGLDERFLTLVYWEWGFCVFLLVIYENRNVGAFPLLFAWVCITEACMFLRGWATFPVLMEV
jgi:hypothetical protein